jgi:hypothetical protein
MRYREQWHINIDVINLILIDFFHFLSFVIKSFETLARSSENILTKLEN